MTLDPHNYFIATMSTFGSHFRVTTYVFYPRAPIRMF